MKFAMQCEVIKEGFSEEVTFGQRNGGESYGGKTMNGGNMVKAGIWSRGERWSRGHSKCKGPEAGAAGFTPKTHGAHVGDRKDKCKPFSLSLQVCVNVTLPIFTPCKPEESPETERRSKAFSVPSLPPVPTATKATSSFQCI